MKSGFIFADSLRENKKVYWVAFFTLLLAIPHLSLIWHGDALDVARHAVIANVQFHLGVWLLIILYLDGVFGKPKLSISLALDKIASNEY